MSKIITNGIPNAVITELNAKAPLIKKPSVNAMSAGSVIAITDNFIASLNVMKC